MDVVENDTILQVINFDINQSHLAIDLKCVHKIILLPTITPIKNAPIYIIGLMNFAGSIIPIIDLFIRLENKKPSKYNINTPILICNQKSGKKIGLLVDRVNDLTLVSKSMLEKNDFNNDKLFSASIRYSSTISLLMDIHYLIKDAFNEVGLNEK